MAFGIRNVPDRLKALKEMKRLLQTNGKSKLAILEFCNPEAALLLLLPFIKLFLKFYIPFIGFLAGGGNFNEYNYLQKSIFDFPSSNGFLQMLHSAGFKDCKSYNISFGVVFLFVCNE